MDDLVEKWRLAAADWLDLQEAADLLRETKNDVFAEITAGSEGASNAEKERNARLSQEWKTYRDKMLRAEADARRAKFRVTYADKQFDAARTAAANARSERGKY